MLTQQYSARQRRALNQVWAAAGEYGFEPLFLALDAQGSPDFYMNFVVGLVHKWYGEEMPRRLFAAWLGDARQPALDDLAWLALENAAYEKELPGRPALEEMRREHARQFFEGEYKLSRQEWMAKNQLVYSMQAARWQDVLGRRGKLLTPWEQGLYRALRCPGSLTADQLEEAIRQIARCYLGFTGEIRGRSSLKLHFSDRWAPLLTKLLPTEMVRTDELTVGRSAGPGQDGLIRAAKGLRSQLRSRQEPESDRQYIESCFGRCLYTPPQMALIEQRRCTGNHLGCHLWFSAGFPSPEKARSAASRRLAEQAEAQREENQKAFARDIALNQSAILRLSGQIQNCLLVHQQPGEGRGRQGRLQSARVWRQPVVGDCRVFTHPEPDPRPGFAVDLLLDASASRLHCQELIAAQGYILSESLSRCGVPVRVSSFCSLRGYTIIRVLKEYADKAGSRRIFGYFAAGWNRDGLALRGMGELLSQAPAQKHLLILLTDASPNDSRKIPHDGRIPLSREYGGKAGVEDAADEVRALRRQGVRVAAVFMGPGASAPDAELIFGRDLVRISRIDQLASAAGRLIQHQIQELSG